MKLMNVYDELDRMVRIYAYKFSRYVPVEFSDFYQELWLFLCEKDFDSLPMANTCLHNRSVDICRKYDKHFADRQFDFLTACADGTAGDSDRYIYNEIDDSEGYVNFEDTGFKDVVSDMIIKEELFSKIPERYQKYVIAKAYLECNIESFRSEFYVITKDLSSDQLNELMFSKKAGSDDLIVRYILGIPSGTNSGSVRRMKRDLKEILEKLV